MQTRHDDVDAGTDRMPDFVEIESMRCGSSTLWRILGRRDRIYVSERKELHFFDNLHGLWKQGVEGYARF